MPDKKKSLHQEIFQNDFRHKGQPHAVIDWSKTYVTVDIRCACGYKTQRFEGNFFFFFRCPHCLRPYAVGRHIKLIPLNQEQVQQIGGDKFHLGSPGIEMMEVMQKEEQKGEDDAE